MTSEHQTQKVPDRLRARLPGIEEAQGTGAVPSWAPSPDRGAGVLKASQRVVFKLNAEGHMDGAVRKGGSVERREGAWLRHSTCKGPEVKGVRLTEGLQGA